MSSVAQDLLVVAASNAVVASLLALMAWLLLARGKHRVAHFVCVVALIKLVTPPLVRLPVAASPEPPVWNADAWLAAVLADGESTSAATGWRWPVLLAAAALLGSCLLAARAALRTRRFRRLLRVANQPPRWLAARAHTLARRMQLRRCPELLVVPARISPMLCVLGRRAHILLPRALLTAPAPELDALVAHELAHAGRRDHWVRALELLATVLYWWLPTAWILRRTLRAAEERCCDECVMAAIPGGSRDYANALLATLDLLAGATRGMPPVACGAGPFTDMKTRLTMIMTAAPTRPMSWILRLTLCAGAALVLPLAPTLAQEPQEAISREELRAARKEIRKLREEMEALRAELSRMAGSDHRESGEKLHERALDKAQLQHEHVRDLIEKLHGEERELDVAGKDKIKKAIAEKLHNETLDKLRLDHYQVRNLLDRLHGDERELDAADKNKSRKALLEKLHEDLLEKAQPDHDHVRSLFEKLHGHEAELDDADKAKMKRSLFEKLHEDLLEKGRLDHDHVRSLFEKLHGHETELDDTDKAKTKRNLLEKLHSDLLDKAQLDHDHVRTLFEKLHGEERAFNAADWDKIMKGISEKLDAAREGKERKRVRVEDAEDEARDLLR